MRNRAATSLQPVTTGEAGNPRWMFGIMMPAKINCCANGHEDCESAPGLLSCARGITVWSWSMDSLAVASVGSRRSNSLVMILAYLKVHKEVDDHGEE
jgi:hypothetical protein